MPSEKQVNQETKVECSICGKEVEKDEIQVTVDGTEMCMDCYEDEGITFTCDDCGEVYNKEEVEITKIENGQKVCDNCRDSNYFYCEDCEGWYSHDDEHYEVRGGDRTICQRCLESDYGICECGYVDNSGNMTYHGDRWYCNDCFGDDLTECEGCGHVIYQDDAYHNEDDEVRCERCYNRETIGRAIHDYSYQPDYKFLHIEGEDKIKKPLYLGLELEVESNRSEELGKKALRLRDWMKSEGIDNYYYMKTDGSLENGFEICSMPMSLKFIKKSSKFKQLTEWMKNNGLSSYKKGTCGFHIHMSRNYFRYVEISKMRGFFASCYAQIFKLSKRGEHTTYAQRENYTIQSFKENLGQSGRYWALNCNTHKATYEVRIFRGTLNYNRLIASIEFVQAIADYVKYVGVSSVFMVGKTGIDVWNTFIDWVKREGRFFQFYNYFTNKCTR